jgi:oligopeptide/dipeptide ABC transporter ATP-binding protein
MAINCSAIPETLLESELFGHVRGAFTGAIRDKPGLFEVAASGTLFLDEVGEIPATLHAKLLRALQEGEIRRVGGERAIKVRPRIIAATNRDLRSRVADGGFREDLYFRLAGFIIGLPPLRERPEDIPPLVHEFLRRANERLKKSVKTIAPQAMTALVHYEWPGNVRELENAIERAVILARTNVLEAEHLPEEITHRADHVAVMYAGQIVESAPTERLFAAPAHPYTQGLFASIPKLTGARGRLTPIPGVVPPPDAWPAGCRFAPRCAFRFDRSDEPPPLLPAGPDHLSRCWLQAEDAR